MIRIEDEAGLRLITLNRPGKANALTGDMLSQLAEAVEGTPGNALVLTGAGKVFSAGADLEAARAGLAVSPLWERLSGAIAGYRGLSIAALNGTVAGGAMGMVLACDLRIAVPGVKTFYPVMKLGFLPQPSDPPRLRALVGPARARMILMAGQKIDAQTALAWGLIDRIVEPSGLLDHARTLCAETRMADPAHVAAIKELCESQGQDAS